MNVTDKQLSTLAYQLRPWVARLVSARAGGSVGSGAAAVARLVAHVAEADPHPQYRLESVDIPLTTDVTGVLPEANGGTNQSTYATGDILYASAPNTLSKLAAGSAHQLLKITGGLPSWASFDDSLHGSRSGGSLHDVATTSVAGFMSAADKLKLDGFGASTLTGSGTAKRLTLWTGANTLGDSAALYTVASAVGGYDDMLVQRGEMLVGGRTAITSLYTGFEATTQAILEVSSRASGGGQFAALVLSNDNSAYVGYDAYIAKILFADRYRSGSFPDDLTAASIVAISEGVYGPRLQFNVATTSTAIASAMEILATRAVWIGYTTNTGTLVGAGDLDIAGDLRFQQRAGERRQPRVAGAHYHVRGW
jgi:hypothetical protein